LNLFVLRIVINVHRKLINSADPIFEFAGSIVVVIPKRKVPSETQKTTPKCCQSNNLLKMWAPTIPVKANMIPKKLLFP
jgi:hypothetical protein